MEPCRVNATERREHTVWTWRDQRRPTKLERHVEAATENAVKLIIIIVFIWNRQTSVKQC